MRYIRPVPNKKNSQVIHIIIIVKCVTCPTASSPWFDAVNLLALIDFSVFSKNSGIACNVLTNSYIWSSGVALSNTYTELHCIQFEHLASACSKRVLYRRTVQSILTGSSAADSTLKPSVHILITLLAE